ncbi:cytochrome b [Vibrio sp. SCSIO 43137]|uniref:cytochrome b n=1 Tax=Vibrio sp. SCSIO 43137 TaxID=3021011 RepID=UPI0023079599|nr:cytochrome b [Vibrio sp. SCSIO 43137]WCE31336.1 cytochrome b [Vibrio sp. SCSIO 43137]
MEQVVKQYNFTSRVLHWVSAIVIIGMFALGLWMMELTYYSSWYQVAPHWHKSVGLVLAGVTLFRLAWKLVTASPKIEGKPLEIIAAKAVHHVMYLLFFVLFISGYLISTSDGRGIEVFNWFVVPSAGELFADQSVIAGQVHYYTAFILIGLAVVHALAALKHHFVDKDDTLRKMTGAIK